MPLSTTPWSKFSASDYSTVRAYAQASLINLNTGPPSGWTKNNIKLPVYEPNGMLNLNGLKAAADSLAGARGGVDAPHDAKIAAAKRLIALYRQASLTPPQAIRDLAGNGDGGMNDRIRGNN